MIGLIGGIFLAAMTFFLVISKFDSRPWVAGIWALVVWGFCGLTGLFGLIGGAIVIGALFKIDV